MNGVRQARQIKVLTRTSVRSYHVLKIMFFFVYNSIPTVIGLIEKKNDQDATNVFFFWKAWITDFPASDIPPWSPKNHLSKVKLK